MILAGAVFLATPHVALADETVYACGFVPNSVFQAFSSYGLLTQAVCPGGGIQISAYSAGFKQGQNAIWQADAPPGLTIIAATVPPGALQSQYVNAGTSGDYGGDFYWTGGSSNIMPGESSASFTGLATPDFGFQLVCGKPTCSGPNFQAYINVDGFVLTVRETTGPTLSAPAGLWQASGWIRGQWPLVFSGDSPSGMCSLTAALAGQTLPGTSSSPSVWLWHQCAAAAVNDPVYTSAYPQGADALQIAGVDAASVPVSFTKTIDVDNQAPTVTLSGPAVAPSTAGTQNVTATATAGPSGVAGISCSVDGARAQWFATSTVQVPVSGIGPHRVTCVSANNAVDTNGVRATSAAQTFSMTIGIPTVTAITFSKLVDKLRCHRAAERVTVPAHWQTVKRGRRRVRVLRRAHLKTVTVTKCHPRTVRRRQVVWITVRRHGRRVRVKRLETVRVIVLPHVVEQAQRRVAHDKATTVNGWLGTYAGVALAGQPVQVMTAPDNGSGAFAPAATTTTAADGSWSATIPAGPSRLIEAAYGGGGSVLPSLSSTVRETVPAEVKLLSVWPRTVAWGGTVRLVGQLVGGYLPPGGALVRLRIGQGAAVTTYGVREHVGGDGRFATTYTFGIGDPAMYRSFWFQIASLPMGDYPYGPADSRRISVVVGGHPVHRRHRRRR